MLKISPLFSGSKGNCTLIQTDKTNILLDLGFGYRAILQALTERNLTPDDIDAIIITHDHGDHTCALPMWTKHTSTPVYVPAKLAVSLEKKTCFSQVIPVDSNFFVKDVVVEIYPCSHDTLCCFGYRICSNQQYFACVTDTGCITDRLVEFLSPCSAIMLESNHDVDMLLKGNYSYPLKRRILSDYGHLSNAQATEILSRLIGKTPKYVILAHLSEINNTHELAFNSVVSMYAAQGLTEGKDVNVYVADQYKNEITICLD